jgi:hypothetical protein
MESMAAFEPRRPGFELSERDLIDRFGYWPRMLDGVRDFGRRHCTLLLVLPLLFYLALPTRNFYWDGVAFAINIEKRVPAASLVHPSHLLYGLSGAWIYRLSEMVGIHTRALFVLQAVNGLLAGLCVLLFYKCLRLRNVPATLGVPMALVFGFSATWCKFATDANAYVPSIFFLLCAYLLIESRKSAVLSGLAQGSALLFHELALLFVPVALLRLRKSRRSVLVYAATALIPVAAAYLVAYSAVSTRAAIPGLIAWATSHTPDSAFNFSPLTDAGFSIRGTLRLFFGGKPGDFVGNAISWAALAALVISTVLFLVFLWRAVRKGAAILPPPLHLVIWAGVYSAFLFVWMPQNTFYRLFYLPSLVAIAAAMLACAPAARAAVWLFAPVLFAWNFCFAVYPQSRPDFNAALHFALVQRHIWPPGTPIVFHGFHPDLWTISYFNRQAAWIGIDHADIGELERSLEYARSQHTPLWLEAAAYDMIAADPNGRRWLAEHERPRELLEAKDEKHDFRFHCVR